MKKKTQLEFGLPVPNGVKVAWGARAIYKSASATFELLWDRQDSMGPKDERDLLKSALDTYLLPSLREQVQSKLLPSSSHDFITFESGPYRVEASPRGSYGYLYMVAYKK